ncbi:unnamed protein product [Ceutorhynchus assimilis]|uniref:Uncharacterized protein n=1 Tax=Ceutorhynchus assimilis TaxID=467358 RepID=A0A9N9MHQ0_9CUCU|nr:unnamed protein product [Ceutorhynchus assimilis]
MSDAISTKIRQLEVQNEKLRRLLDSTFEITRQDAAKCRKLTLEVDFLRQAIVDLENQKQELEDELMNEYLDKDHSDNNKADIECRLKSALDDIQRGSSEIKQLNPEGPYLTDALVELEKEKELLLSDIELLKKANEQQNAFVQENLLLKQEIANLETIPASISNQDLVDKLVSIQNSKQTLLADINAAKLKTDPLGIPIENTVLELKICGLENQMDKLLINLKTSLLQSANEISTLYANTSDNQLRGLLNELDIQKTILLMNLTEIKEMHSESKNLTPDVSICSELSHHDLLATVSEEDEAPNFVAEPEINQDAILIVPSKEVPTNKMNQNDEQLLVHGIQELEEDKDRIGPNLDGDLMVDVRAVLEEGERLIRCHQEKN